MYKNIKIKEYIVIFILTFFSLFLFSSVSPLYDIMNLQYDQQLYDLIGKGIASGLVPYIDLIDHKGIYLFMSYGIANIISDVRHIGLFIVSIFYFYLNAIFTYKLSRLLISHFYEASDKIISWISIIVSFIITYILNTVYLSVSGLDCETMMIPFITISFYLYMKHILCEEGRPYSLASIYINGICFGIILFIKANADLFFVSILIMLIYDTVSIYHDASKIIKRLLLYFVCGIMGIIISILPGLIYCISNNCLHEMIDQSFIVNFIYTGAGFAGAENNLEAFKMTIGSFREFLAISIISIPVFFYINKNKKARIFYIISTVLFLIMVIMPLRPYYHYVTLLLITYIPVTIFFVISIIKLLPGDENITKKLIGFSAFVVFIIALMTYNLNTDVAIMNGDVHIMLARKIRRGLEERLGRRYDKRIDNKLLVIGNGTYVYEYLDIIPPEPNFAIPSMLPSEYPEPYEKMIEYVREKKEDFILLIHAARGEIKENAEFYDRVKIALADGYEDLGSFTSSAYKVEVYMKHGKQ